MSNTNTLVELVNPFVAAGFSTLSMILNESPSRGQLSATPTAVTSHQVNIVIGITGDIVGHVIIGMSLITADKTASIMIGQQVTTFDELAASAVGELGNMICGNGLLNLSQQGYTCDLTPPTVIRGSKVEISTLAIPSIIVPLSTETGEFELMVGLRPKKDAKAA